VARYRIDFSRLARSEDDVYNSMAARQFLTSLMGSDERSLEAYRSFESSLSEGHVLDSIKVEDQPGLNGNQVLEKHVKGAYPEAKLLSWDSY
jgi:hypothetical protein